MDNSTSEQLTEKYIPEQVTEMEFSIFLLESLVETGLYEIHALPDNRVLLQAMLAIGDREFWEKIEDLYENFMATLNEKRRTQLRNDCADLLLLYIGEEDLKRAEERFDPSFLVEQQTQRGEQFMKEIDKICSSKQSDQMKLSQLDALEEQMLKIVGPMEEHEDLICYGDRHPFEAYLCRMLLVEQYGEDSLDSQNGQKTVKSGVEIFPYGDLYARKGELYERLHQPEKAIEVLNASALHLKGNASVRLALARLYTEQGDLVSAYDNLQEAYSRVGRLADLQQFWLTAVRFFKKSDDEQLMLYAAAMADALHVLPKKERISLSRTKAFNKEKLLLSPKNQQEFLYAFETPGLMLSDQLFEFLSYYVRMFGSLEDYAKGKASLEDCFDYGWTEQMMQDEKFIKDIRKIGRIARETSRALVESPFGPYYVDLACGDIEAAEAFKNQ